MAGKRDCREVCLTSFYVVKGDKIQTGFFSYRPIRLSFYNVLQHILWSDKFRGGSLYEKYIDWSLSLVHFLVRLLLFDLTQHFGEKKAINRDLLNFLPAS